MAGGSPLSSMAATRARSFTVVVSDDRRKVAWPSIDQFAIQHAIHVTQLAMLATDQWRTPYFFFLASAFFFFLASAALRALNAFQLPWITCAARLRRTCSSDA